RIERQFKRCASGAVKAPNVYTLLSMRHGGQTPVKSDKNTRIIEEAAKESEKENTRFENRGIDSSFGKYTAKEKRIIELYHRIIVNADPNWLRVTRFSQPLREAIERIHETATDFLETAFQRIANDAETIGTRQRTLV